MRVAELILQKRNGGELADSDIQYLVRGYAAGDIPDYQMAALCMAIFFKGLGRGETIALTRAMLESGATIDLSGIPGTKVDKHSTGGVGDKTTLVLAPLLAAAGLPVAKMAGRGLGHTGGTIDKLESIPGFCTELSRAQFLAQVGRIGIAIAAQTADLVPADKKLYALRDVTATVDSLPLIASSIMAKKLAVGADLILLDVKVGNGALLPERRAAIELAGLMVEIGAVFGRRVVAVLTPMEQPLGYAVGNALEVSEAIDTLKNAGPPDLTELCLELAAQALVTAGQAAAKETAKTMLKQLLAGGAALTRLRQFIEAQGGDPGIVDHQERLPRAAHMLDVAAPGDGFVAGIRSREIGEAAMGLGAGRAASGDAIDHAAGIVLKAKIGDQVEAGQSLARLYTNDMDRGLQAIARIQAAFELAKAPVDRTPIIWQTIRD